MPRAAVLLALVAGLCLASHASAAYLVGVAEKVNVTALARYVNQTLDSCDIYAYSQASEYLLAADVYKKGKNSRNTAGVLRIMEAFTNRNFSGEGWYDTGVTYFGFPNWADFLFGRAVTGQWPYDVSRGARKNSIWMYAIGYNVWYTMHEIDAGFVRAKAGSFAQAAAEAEDSIAVIWGGEYGVYCSVPQVLYDASKWSCTLTRGKTGSSVILDNIVAGFKALQAAADANSSAGYDAARLKVFNGISAGLLQWVHRGARGAQVAKDIDTYRAQIAIARAAFNIIAPHLKSVAPTSTDAFVAATNFDTRVMDKKVLSKVRAAIATVAPAIGYTFKTIYAC